MRIGIGWFIVTTILLPLVVGVGLWYLSYYTWAADTGDRGLTSLAWGILSWVGTVAIAMLINFVIVLIQTSKTVVATKVETLKKIEGIEEKVSDTLKTTAIETAHIVGQEVMRSALQLRDAGTVCRNVSDIFAKCPEIQHFLLIAGRLLDASISEVFSKEGIIMRHGVGDAEYCSLLMEACHLAKKSIYFTCLESSYWFMLGMNRPGFSGGCVT